MQYAHIHRLPYKADSFKKIKLKKKKHTFNHFHIMHNKFIPNKNVDPLKQIESYNEQCRLQNNLNEQKTHCCAEPISCSN